MLWSPYTKGLSMRLSQSLALEKYFPAFVFSDLYAQAAACDSMTLLMKKLDHLNEGIQEVRGTVSSCSHRARADEEQQSNTVSQRQLNTVISIHVSL